jgi:acyl dehydratase
VALNASLAGKSYPPVAFALEAGRVAAFASAVGHRGGGVPPTFVTAPELAAGLANVVADPELGLDLSRVLHGEQEYAWERPLEVGETVSATATIAEVRSRGALEFLTLRTEVRDEAGSVVVRGTSRLIVRGRE